MTNVLERFEAAEVLSGYRQFVEGFGDYAELARDSADDADSYRGLDVGVVGLAIRPGVRDLITVCGANYKMRYDQDNPMYIPEDDEHDDIHDEFQIPRDIPKVCGEMDVCAGSASSDDLFFVAKIIAATSNVGLIKDITGIATPTLPPCGECTLVLDKSDHTSRATLYSSVGLYKDIFQIRNMRHLRELHKRKSEKDLPVGRITPMLSRLALEQFDHRVAAHYFSGVYPSRVISSIARTSLLSSAT